MALLCMKSRIFCYFLLLNLSCSVKGHQMCIHICQSIYTFFCFVFLFPYIKGKKSNVAEKAFPPAEQPEPVLPGSSAIGSVSLAVAKAAAQIQGIPFYKYIAALKTREVRPHKRKQLYNTKNKMGATSHDVFNYYFRLRHSSTFLFLW